MSDVVDGEIEEELAEEGGGGEFEYVVGEDLPKAEPEPEEDLPEDLRGLSKAEIARRLKESEERAALGAGFERGLEKLGERLGGPRGPENGPPPPPPSFELSAEDEARVRDELYKSENPAALIKGIIEKTVGKKLEYVTAGVAAEFAKQEGELLRAYSPEYKRWESEVEAELGRLPAGQRAVPGARKAALDRVKLKNLDKLVEEGVKAALEKAQLPPKSGPAPARGKLVAPSSPEVAGGVSAPSGKTKLYMGPEDLVREKERAAAKGISWEAWEKTLPAKYGKPRAVAQGGRR